MMRVSLKLMSNISKSLTKNSSRNLSGVSPTGPSPYHEMGGHKMSGMPAGCGMNGMVTPSPYKATVGRITEFDLKWDTEPKNAGSTHELVMDAQQKIIYVTGQNAGKIAKLNYNGEVLTHYVMPQNSGPHGLLVDKNNNLWVSLEFFGQVARLDGEGKIVETVDVNIYPNNGQKNSINPAPHGIGLDKDGSTIWFTGKRTSTVGKFTPPSGTVYHYELPQLAALPIFLSASNDGQMYGTELLGNNILNVTSDGCVREFPIPTAGSRPIAVIPDPKDNNMWFTQEAGQRIGRVDSTGYLTEFQVPCIQPNDILASLCFDKDDNLWVQVYVDFNNPKPTGNDYIIKFDKSIRDAMGKTNYNVPFTTYNLPSRRSMMHRIRPDNDGNIWFTQMATDKIGKISIV